MPRINNAMEVFKLLNRSNCRDCREKTCMAFAVAVFKGRRELADCPHLGSDILKKFEGDIEKPNTIDEDMRDAVEALKQKIPEIDLESAARRVGASFAGNKLTLKVCGKDFSVNSKGMISADIHVNPWVAVPVLRYILESDGKPVSGNWVSFRELKNGPERFSLFQQKCEKTLKAIADRYPALFKDMLDIFDGRRVETHFDSDISIVLRPLPRFPILICYWKPEEGLDSDLHVFFDAVSEENLDIESIYTLVMGIVGMFGKISLRHGAN